MSKKISQTQLVAKYGDPKISYGKSTGLLRFKPSLTFVMGGGTHVSIVPDETWRMSQMLHEASDEFDEDAPLHTSVGDITFDEFHVTADAGGSVFIKLTGAVQLNDGGDELKKVGLEVGSKIIGFEKG